MRKFVLLFLTAFLLTRISYGQGGHSFRRPWKLNISSDTNVPLDKFRQTHFIGLNLSVAAFKHYFQTPDSNSAKPLGYFVNAGVDNFFGVKKAFLLIFPYEFSSTTFIHIAPGLILRTGRKTHILGDIGPALNLYSGNADLGFITNFGGYFMIRKNIALNSQLGAMKLPRADPLFFIRLGATFFIN